LIKPVLKKKTIQAILAENWQKILTSSSKSALNQPFTSQASNNLLPQAWVKLK